MSNRPFSKTASICVLAFYALILSAADASAKDDMVGVTVSSGLFDVIREFVTGEPSATVRVHGGDEVFVSSKTEGGSRTTVYMGGAVATAFFSDNAEPPKAPQSIELRNSSNHLIGGMTEMLPGSGILVTARHVLQGTEKSSIEAAFREKGLDLSKYGFYQFRREGRDVDVILAVPVGKEDLIMERANPDASCNCASDGFQLRELKEFEESPQVNDRYFSYQYGIVGNHKAKQISQGKISRASIDRFYLDLTEDNHTTAGSSGSVVYTGKKADLLTSGDSSSSWKTGGIVECVIPPRRDRHDRPIPGGIQVIPVSNLLDSGLSPIPLNALIAEKPVLEENGCKKIGGGDAGGD